MLWAQVTVGQVTHLPRAAHLLMHTVPLCRPAHLPPLHHLYQTRRTNQLIPQIQKEEKIKEKMQKKEKHHYRSSKREEKGKGAVWYRNRGKCKENKAKKLLFSCVRRYNVCVCVCA